MDKLVNKVVSLVQAIGYTPHSYPLPIGMIVSEQRVLAKYCLESPRVPGAVFVEIGSFFGGSACILAACSQLRLNDVEKPLEVVVSIDKFQLTPIDRGLGSVENYKNIMTNIGWQDYQLINENSALSRPTYNEKVNKPISFLFIDGGHRYHECKADFYAYQDLVVPGGHICFHDCGDTDKDDTRTEEEILAQNNEYDVTPFCKRVCEQHPEYTNVEKVREGNSIYVIRKN